MGIPRPILLLCFVAPVALVPVAAQAHVTTTTTEPAHCGDGHGDDNPKNKHCATTTTTAPATTTTTGAVILPTTTTAPAATTTTDAVTTTSTAATTTTAAPTVTTTAPVAPPALPTAVLGTQETRLPTTGFPTAFLGFCGLLALAFGLVLRRIGLMSHEL